MYHRKGRVTRSCGRKHSVADLFFFLWSNDAHLHLNQFPNLVLRSSLCFTSSFCATQRLVIESFFTRVFSYVSVCCPSKHCRAVVDLTSIGKLSSTRLTVQLNQNDHAGSAIDGTTLEQKTTTLLIKGSPEHRVLFPYLLSQRVNYHSAAQRDFCISLVARLAIAAFDDLNAARGRFTLLASRNGFPVPSVVYMTYSGFLLRVSKSQISVALRGYSVSDRIKK